MLRKKYIPAVLAIVLIVLALFLKNYLFKDGDLAREAGYMQRALQEQELLLDRQFQNTDFIEQAISDSIADFGIKVVETLEKEKFQFFIYQEDSLVFWSSNQLLPYFTDVDVMDSGGQSFVEYQGGSFVLKKRSFTSANGKNYDLVGAIPIVRNYPVSNEYLTSGIVLSNRISNRIQVSSSAPGHQIAMQDGNALFNIYSSGSELPAFNQFIIALLWFGGLILLIPVGFEWFSKKAPKYQLLSFLGYFFFCAALVGINYLVAMSVDLQDLKLCELQFSPASFFGRSLGDFVLTVLCGFALALFLQKHLSFNSYKQNSTGQKITLSLFVYFLGIATLYVVKTCGQMIALRTNLSFDFDNIFNVSPYSFLTVFLIAVIALSQFIFSYKLFRITSKIGLSIRTKLILLGISAALITIANLLDVLSADVLQFSIFALCFVALMEIYANQKASVFGWLIYWMVFYSAFISNILSHYQHEQEIQTRINFAQELLDPRDSRAEYSIKKIESRIASDNFLKRFALNPFFSRQRLNDRILKLSEPEVDLLNKYVLEMHVYSPAGNRLKGERTPYSDILRLKESAVSQIDSTLYLLSSGSASQHYLSEIDVKFGRSSVAKVVLRFNARELKALGLYPELLMSSELKERKSYAVYEYGIYEKNRLFLASNNHAQFDLTNLKNQNKRQFTFFKNGTSYLYQNNGKGRVALIGKPVDNALKPFSLFSYVFCFLLIIAIIYAVIDSGVRSIPRFLSGNFSSQPSLRNRIQLSVIAVILLTFVIIGLVTLIFFQEDSRNYHKSRLARKATSLYNDAQSRINTFGINSTANFLDIDLLSQIHRMDVNLYDLKGDLISSSQPTVFSKGLQSKKIPIEALIRLKNSKRIGLITRDEQIGNLKFKSAYQALFDYTDELNPKPKAIIGLPYYSEQGNLRQDITSFIGTLLNVYVLLLLLAGTIAILIANSVTRPLTLISENLKRVRLGQKNEPIQWNRTDELGELISQYNHMVNELEDSANLLAQSERESAWREMAKQVAHEIKNPLTPMKLNVQLLSRIYDTDPEQGRDRLKAVAQDLIQQIDNLSRIASEFGNFAKMPSAQNEIINLNQVMQSVFNVFSERENMDLELNLPNKDIFVFADSGQLMRVMNNVIKNAIQAIPEEKYGEIVISLQPDHGDAHIRIRDNGVGISISETKVFEPNFTTKSSGMGLGLSMSKKIIENANGSISFESTPNVETVFHIKLPMVDNPNQKEISL